MENDSLKSAWKQMVIEDKSSQELHTILRERSRTLAKRVRRQLIIEVLATAILLVVYYDFFDGDQKPFSANVLLVCAWILVIIHNIIGYVQFKPGSRGQNLEQLLSNRVFKMKTYAMTAGILRVLAAASFLFFFISVISFTPVKYWILGGIIVLFIIQMAMFFKMWQGRIRRITQVVKSVRGT